MCRENIHQQLFMGHWLDKETAQKIESTQSSLYILLLFKILLSILKIEWFFLSTASFDCDDQENVRG